MAFCQKKRTLEQSITIPSLHCRQTGTEPRNTVVITGCIWRVQPRKRRTIDLRSISRTSVSVTSIFGLLAPTRLRREPFSGWLMVGRSRSRIGTSANQIISGKSALRSQTIYILSDIDCGNLYHCDTIGINQSLRY